MQHPPTQPGRGDGLLAKAAVLARRALKILIESVGPEHEWTQASRENLSRLEEQT